MRKKIILNIDSIIEMLIDGKSYRQIADFNRVALTTLHDFTSKAEHSARVREALDYSADTFADKAEEVLLDAPPELIEIQRARELAQFYKWKAAKRSPKKYGEKVQQEITGNVTTNLPSWLQPK